MTQTEIEAVTELKLGPVQDNGGGNYTGPKGAKGTRENCSLRGAQESLEIDRIRFADVAGATEEFGRASGTPVIAGEAAKVDPQTRYGFMLIGVTVVEANLEADPNVLLPDKTFAERQQWIVDQVGKALTAVATAAGT